METAKKKTPKRKRVLVTLGDRLRKLRGKRPLVAIAAQLEALDAPLKYSALAQYELGTTRSPDPSVLAALAKIYSVDLDDLLRLIRDDRKRCAAERVGKNRTDASRDELKSTDKVTFARDNATRAIADTAALDLPAGAHHDHSRRPARSVRSRAAEDRLDAIATRLNDTHAAFVELGKELTRALADAVARAHVDRQITGLGPQPPKRGRPDR